MLPGFSYKGPDNPPATVTAANNGVSLDGTTVVLGDDGTAPPGPGQLLSPRQIFTNGFSIILNGGLAAVDFSATLSANGFTFVRNDGLVIGDYQAGQMTLLDDTTSRPVISLVGGGVIFDIINDSGSWAVELQSAPGSPLISIPNATQNFIIGNLVDNNSRLQVDGNVSMLSVTANLDFPNTLPFTSSDLTIVFLGAALNDMVVLGLDPTGLDANSSYWQFVDSPDSVTVRFINSSAVAIDPVARDFTVSIFKRL